MLRARHLLWLFITCCCLGQRIVSLAPNLTEICCALGACEQLVGVTNFCTYPPDIDSATRIGGYLDPNLEVILSLDPQLILAVPEHQQITARLKSMGYRVETIKNWSLSDIHASILKVGELLNRSSQARDLNESLIKIRESLRVRANKQRPSCLVVIGQENADGHIRSVFAVARNGFLNEILTLAGGQNAYPKENPYFAQLSQESILHLNPDVVIELLPQAHVSPEEKKNQLEPWFRIKEIEAVRHRRVFLVNGDGVMTPGPRYVDTLKQFADALGR